jgi:hypothetical protein
VYVKGQDLIYEQPESENVELLIDQGHYWATAVNDVDKAQWDISWMDKFSSDAGEQLKIKVDANVLNKIYPDFASFNKGVAAGRKSGGYNLGATGSPVALDKTNVVDYCVHLGSVLDEANVPENGRWLVMPAIIANLLKRSDLKNALITGDAISPLRNGKIGMIDRFEVFKSNLLTSVSDGGHSCYTILAGHKSGLTFAGQVTETDTMKNPKDFGQLVRHLFVYGFKVNYGQALAGLYAYATL